MGFGGITLTNDHFYTILKTAGHGKQEKWNFIKLAEKSVNSLAWQVKHC